MEPWTGGQLHPVLSDLAMLTTLYNDVLTSPAPPCQQMWPSLSALRVTGSPSSLLYPCDVSVLNLERRRLHRRQDARSRRPAPFFSRRSVAERRQPPSKQPSSQAAKQPSSKRRGTSGPGPEDSPCFGICFAASAHLGTLDMSQGQL